MNELAEELLKAMLPGTYLVEVFPWMLHIPSFMAKWKRDALANFRKFDELYKGLFRDVEARIVRPPFSHIIAVSKVPRMRVNLKGQAS
jgi:hypothetical protein